MRRRMSFVPPGKPLKRKTLCAGQSRWKGVSWEAHTMKEVANHIGPESCVGVREGAGEALTGERAGRVSSRESYGPLRGADAVEVGGRRDSVRCHREAHRDPARSETPGMCGNTSRENRESPSPPVLMAGQAVSGSPRTYADDERTWEVGQAHSTREVSEQTRATWGGGDGGKAASQRECAKAPISPDAEPE